MKLSRAMPTFWPGVTLWTTRTSTLSLFSVAYSSICRQYNTKKEIACGLVDTVGHSLPIVPLIIDDPVSPGSYTFARTLEYKAKHGLQSGKEVTVVPPIEYQERIVTALEGYFLACPGQLCQCLLPFLLLTSSSQINDQSP